MSLPQPPPKTYHHVQAQGMPGWSGWGTLQSMKSVAAPPASPRGVTGTVRRAMGCPAVVLSPSLHTDSVAQTPETRCLVSIWTHTHSYMQTCQRLPLSDLTMWHLPAGDLTYIQYVKPANWLLILLLMLLVQPSPLPTLLLFFLLLPPLYHNCWYLLMWNISETASKI